MSIARTASFAVPRADLAIAVEAVRDFIAAISETEPGTHLYAAFTSGEDPVDFLHVMIFTDTAAQDLHRTSAAVRRFTDVLYPVTVDGVRFSDLDLLATTPLSARGRRNRWG